MFANSSIVTHRELSTGIPAYSSAYILGADTRSTLGEEQEGGREVGVQTFWGRKHRIVRSSIDAQLDVAGFHKKRENL